MRTIFQKGRIVATTFLVLLYTSSAYTAANSYDKLQQYEHGLDILTFDAGDNYHTLVEVIVQVPTQGLQFIKCRQGFMASFKLDVTVSHLNAEVIRRTYCDSILINRFKEIDMRRPDQILRFSLLLAPGEYMAKVAFEDEETKSSLIRQKDFIAPDYCSPILSISDIQLVVSISPVKTESSWTKGGYDIVPNVYRKVQKGVKRLICYTEIYNRFPQTTAFKKATLACYKIIDLQNRVVQSHEEVITTNNYGIMAVGRFNDKTLKPGEYRLQLEVSFDGHESKVVKSVGFTVLAPVVNLL